MIFMFFKPSNLQQKKSAPTTNASTTNIQLPFKDNKTTPFPQNLQNTNLVEQHYLFNIQNPVDMSDPTIALILQIPTIPNEKRRFLDIQSFSTFLLNYGGTDFPPGISLCSQQISGYMDKNGTATNIVANTAPTQISTVINAGGIIGYNVVYKNQSGVIWDITGINTLTFKMKLFGDTQFRALPSAQPLQVSVKISRVVF